MPPERSRPSNSQGRQKSCAECAKAKRRCDLRQPSCLRCNRQSLACSYPPQPSPIATPVAQRDTPIEDFSSGNHMLQLDSSNIPSEESIGLLDFNFLAGNSSVDALNELLNDDIEETFPLTRPNHASGKAFSASHVSPFAMSRISYSIEQLKLAPALMVSENCTPWSHRFLYEEDMPRSLQEAHATCALYVAKNETNATLVARHLVDRARELVESPLPTASAELLAHAHALLLYQIMLVFSGDIRFYAQAEANIEYLEYVCNALYLLAQQEIDPSGPLPIYPSTSARAAWKSFVFRESARRTLLVIVHCTGLCNLLRGRVSSCSHHLAIGNRVAFSAHLWNAKSAFDFAVAWNEKEHFLVKDLDCTDLLEAARPHDIDVFGKVMLTGIMGIDDVKGWFHTRGGAL